MKDFEEKILKNFYFLFFDFTCLKSRVLSELRKEAKKAKGEILVIKKKLAKKVFEKLEIPFDFEGHKGQLAVLFSPSEDFSLMKILSKASQKNENLKILGLFWQKEFFPAERVKEIVKWKDRNEILSDLIFLLQSPIVTFVKTLKGNLEKFLFLLSKVKAEK